LLGQVDVWFDVGSSVGERLERCCDKKWCLVSYVKQILERERGREVRRESERAVVMASCVLYTLAPSCSTEQSVHHNLDNNQENSL